MFIAPVFELSVPFADQFGLERTEMGCIAVDAFQATSMPGVFAAGDASQKRDMPMPMSSVLTSQAQGLVAGGAVVGTLLSQ